MVRDLARLERDSFDVVVIGGGIYGLSTAWELASGGLRVAIVERDDFGGGTSFNSLKTIHGGIRPLQHGALREMREFVREQRAIATIAPHLVRPLAFVVPTYRHPVRNRFAMGIFFRAFDRLAADRSAGVDPSRRLPPSRLVSRAECLEMNPAIDPAGVTGGAVWHDYQLHSPERYALALLHSAHRAGAAAANYTEAVGLLARDHRVGGIRLRDRLSGGEFEVAAPVVVNAAGPGAWPFLERAGQLPSSRPAPRFSLAMNLVVSHAPLSNAVGGVVEGRFLFMVPWRDRSIVGTSHDEAEPVGGGAPRPSARQVEAFLREAMSAFPQARLTPAHVTLVHRGLLPAGRSPGSLLKHSIVHDHAADDLTGLLTVVGVRYTTARATATAAAGAVGRLLERPPAASRTAMVPIEGGNITALQTFERAETARSGLPRPLVGRLIASYGTTWTAVETLIRDTPALGTPLSPACPITRAEVLHAAREEMAVHLPDALLRRTSAGAGGHPGADAVAAAADVMAAECGWSPGRRSDEISAVADFYRS